ncbi:hypothetical protein P5673_016057 [Acropora cervicornis]|uniref:Uncharacterized protein n=1 Tax=Acropora cervicornis TaxID=6130 RepID=A0AAD9QGP1_ACRCE|nr:hypothetical protein P5673_016057 [Acropora cervicornis]
MRKYRTCPRFSKFVGCYLCVCATVYLYYRHSLSNDADRDTPVPTDVSYDEMLRPIETFSSGKDGLLPTTLLAMLYKNKVLGKPNEAYSLRLHQSKLDAGVHLEDDLKVNGLSFEKKSHFSETEPSVTSSVPEFSFNSEDSFADFDKQQNDNSSNLEDNFSVGNSTPNVRRPVDSSSKLQVVRNPLITSTLFRDFRRDWLRQRRARLDWQSMLKPCHDNMEWGLVKKYWAKENRSSARTSEVVYKDIRPAGEFSKIFIQSKTADNRTKLIGGDTWRVYAHGVSSVAATMFDHGNGTYEAVFLLTEPGNYHVMIYLDYSLCDGFKDPPRDWFIMGNVQGKYQKEGLLGTLDEYLLEPYHNGRPVIISVPHARFNATFIETLQNDLGSCSETCNHLWDGFGRWTNNMWRPYLKESTKWTLPRHYQRNGTFWIYGDSLAVRLQDSVRNRKLCRKFYRRCFRSYNWIYPVYNEWMNKVEDDDLDFDPQRVIIKILEVLDEPFMQTENSVLLLNLGLHFPIGINFTTYQGLIDDLIRSVKETEVDSRGIRVPLYKAKVIWKTSTAIHKENAPSKNTTNWRFFTTQRVALFSAYAMSAMCQAGFDVIDVYPMTDSYPSGTDDVVHYPNHVFNSVETLLEKYKAHNNKKLGENENKARIKRCIA